MRSLFISDLHLTPKRPDISRAFLCFLKETVLEQAQAARTDIDTSTNNKNVDVLYILGDFFEYWISDDVMDEFQHMIASELRKVADAGVQIYFMHGNRDFMVGKAFCQLAGCTPLPDPTVIALTDTEHGARQVLLMHGDSLCTDDKGYQRFRRIVRWPWLQKLFLALPGSYRKNIARKIRSSSKTQIQDSAFESAKAHRIIDVNQQAVMQVVESHGAHILIHGHTHMMDTHPLTGQRQRIVLGDWDTHGCYLRHDNRGFQLVSWDLSCEEAFGKEIRDRRRSN